MRNGSFRNRIVHNCFYCNRTKGGCQTEEQEGLFLPNNVDAVVLREKVILTKPNGLANAAVQNLLNKNDLRTRRNLKELAGALLSNSKCDAGSSSRSKLEKRIVQKLLHAVVIREIDIVSGNKLYGNLHKGVADGLSAAAVYQVPIDG